MNDEVLVRYLLGQLGPEDAERLDEASIVDDETEARVRLVEHDLVDRYVRGTLSGEMLSRFESHYLSSPLRRENVRLASRLVHAVDRVGARREGERREPDSSAGETAGTAGQRRTGARWLPS